MLHGEVSVATIVSMLQVIYRRFPRRLLPPLLCNYLRVLPGKLCCHAHTLLRANLCELGDKIDASSKHAARTFWRWLEKQTWRQMLPQPWPSLGRISSEMHRHLCYVNELTFGDLQPRVEVVLALCLLCVPPQSGKAQLRVQA